MPGEATTSFKMGSVDVFQVLALLINVYSSGLFRTGRSLKDYLD